MKKQQFLFLGLLSGAFLLLYGVCLCLGRWAPWLSLTVAALATLLLMGMLALRWHGQRRSRRTLELFTAALDPRQQTLLETFPMPAAAFSASGELVYYNDSFLQDVLGGDEQEGANLSELFSDLTVKDVEKKTCLDVRRGSQQLTAYVNRIPGDVTGTLVLYFCDTTALKEVAAEYRASRPVVLLICIDNLEEVTRELRDSDRARIAGQIETALDDWIAGNGGILRKLSSERLIAVTENRCLNEMTRSRFPILDRVRKGLDNAPAGITLSIGVGQGKTLLDGERTARRALEMALARGGDQAAVKTANGFDFYGGKSRGVERRTKVRTRIVAQALRELILSSDRVILMGHRLSDLDSLGSCTALAVAIRRLGKDAYVAVHRRTTMAGELIHAYEDAGQNDLFLEPEEAMDWLSEQTLLIITDTHSESLLDSGELYRAAGKVAIIDHHRKMVDHIADAALEYQEASSSSASELVTELLQYMGDSLIGAPEAEALLAGIMLDTRNFVLRTGSRTFEAAAYLRRRGADTVSVKRMFADSLETYRRKCDLVAAAGMFHDMAIAVSEEDFSQYRAAAAQAADDMLSIRGVAASFVVCRMGRDVNVSARSYGSCNVQVIMEALGGGGHMTMAAAQFRELTVRQVEMKLREQIVIYAQQNREIPDS